MATFDLSLFAQRANMNLTNMDEAIRKWVDFVAAPAGNVTMQYYDGNGNLQTVTFPNRNSLVNQLIADANSVMSKTVYVDQINGNDDNDGSRTSPFKTISKAVSVVPSGGTGYINLLSNLDYRSTGDEHVEITNKTIYIGGHGRKIMVGWFVNTYDNNFYYLRLRFHLRSSRLFFQNTLIHITSDGNPTINNALYTRFIKVGDNEPAHVSFIYNNISNTEPVIKVERGYLVAQLGGWSDINSPFLSVTLTTYLCSNNKVVIYPGSYFIYHPVYALGVGNVVFNDGSSDNVPIQNYLYIIRDSNGVPRNVISNLVL